MKTIGVIGGIGPQATMDFEARVHAVSQQLIPQHWNTGYPPMVVYYHRYPPFVVDERGVPIPPRRPEVDLTAALDKLGAMVDFLVITSNAPHMFQALIEETSGRKVLNMINVTLDEVRKRAWRRVGVLGFGDPAVYLTPLGEMGVACEALSGDTGGLRDKIDQAVIALMGGQVGPEAGALASEAVETLRARGVDGIILGCTEIPLLLGDAAQAPDLLNPLQLLAESAVRFALDDE